MKIIRFLKILLIAFFIFILKPNFAQSPDWIWAKSMYGNDDFDTGYSIAVDSFGNVYTTGSFEDTVDFDPGLDTFNLIANGPWDIFISKLDSQGNFIWAKTMSGPSAGSGQAIILDASANIYITGDFGGTVDFDPGPGTFNLTAAGDPDIYVAKLDSSGNLIWAKRMGGNSINEIGISITLDGADNVYTTGWFQGTSDFDPGPGLFNLVSSSSSNTDIFVSKLDSSGNFIWAKSMGGTGVDEAWAITVDTWGNVYTTGWFKNTADFDPGNGIFNLSTTGNYEMFISKLDNAGNFIWAKEMDVGTNLSTAGYSIITDPFGNIFTTGIFQGIVDFDPGQGIYNLNSNGSVDGFISKLDSSGGFQWAKAIDATTYAFGVSIIYDNTGSGGVYIAGYFDGTVDFDPGMATYNLTSVGDEDIFILKSDTSGNFIWAKSLGGTHDDQSKSIALSMDGNIHMTGYFDSGSILFGSTTLTNAGNTFNSHEIFIAKLDTLSPTGIGENISSDVGIILYPNPFSDALSITIQKQNIDQITFKIFDILGQTVYIENEKKFINATTKSIDLSFLSKGIYFLETLINGERKMAKIIKE